MRLLCVLASLMACAALAHEGHHEGINSEESARYSSKLQINLDLRMHRFSSGLPTDRDQQPTAYLNKLAHPGHGGVGAATGRRPVDQSTIALSGELRITEHLALTIATAILSGKQTELSFDISHTLSEAGLTKVFYSVGSGLLLAPGSTRFSEASLNLFFALEKPKFGGVITAGYQLTSTNLMKSGAATSHLVPILFRRSWSLLTPMCALLLSLEPALLRPGIMLGVSLQLI